MEPTLARKSLGSPEPFLAGEKGSFSCRQGSRAATPQRQEGIFGLGDLRGMRRARRRAMRVMDGRDAKTLRS
jgi:hypothetical protein